MKELINDVSDTALWIAAYRALETDRPDAVFKDPLARKLAGTKGFEIVNITPNKDTMGFAMVVRTAAIDRLVELAVSKGIDMVINLGAGLDTRPYRMNLPKALRWVEVDFPSIITYKNDLLFNDKPVCHLERIICDLSDDAERKSLFNRLGAETTNALVITEGVIPYLSDEDAAKLSNDIIGTPAFQYWIMDYSQGANSRREKTSRELSKILKNAPFKFKDTNPKQFFGNHGWHVFEDLHLVDEARRIGKRPPSSPIVSFFMSVFAKKAINAINEMYGYVMFSKESL